jgi:hypothetical protein
MIGNYLIFWGVLAWTSSYKGGVEAAGVPSDDEEFIKCPIEIWSSFGCWASLAFWRALLIKLSVRFDTFKAFV